MKAKHLRDLQKNEVVRKRLAKYLALNCFRNTALEDLHSGTGPISESGDYSDVKVITPRGEILWTNLSRFDNKEMKALMKDVVNRCDLHLAIIFSTPVGDELIEGLGKQDLVPEWDDPDWENDREPQLIRDSLRKALGAERKRKRKRVGKTRGRPAGKK